MTRSRVPLRAARVAAVALLVVPATLVALASPARAQRFPDEAWGIHLLAEVYDHAGAVSTDVLDGDCTGSRHRCGVTGGGAGAAIADGDAHASVSLEPAEGFWRQRLRAFTDGTPAGGGQSAFAEVDVLEKIRVEAGDAELPADARVPLVVHVHGRSRLEDAGSDASRLSLQALASIVAVGTGARFLRATPVLEDTPGQHRWSEAAWSSAVPLDRLLGVRLITLALAEQQASGSPNTIEAELAWRICSAIPGVRIVHLSPGHGDGDLDGDALPDCREVAGLDADGDGTVEVDLPAMGADPSHKDLFVEVDYMVDTRQGTAHSHQPKPAALFRAESMFALAPVENPDGEPGIRLHVDAGPDSVMDPVTRETWGSRSGSDALDHEDGLGSTDLAGRYSWRAFDRLRREHFLPEREAVFRYAIFAHALGGGGKTSGIARDIPGGEFLVTLGSWSTNPGTVLQQAGTFVHELGHTLGLRHGGPDDGNHEPNHLSVMNYAFQTLGLRVAGRDGMLDYSAFDLPDLDEDALDEIYGLSTDGVLPEGYGTRWYCNGVQQLTDTAESFVDWDCDGTFAGELVSANVNKSQEPEDRTTVLTTHDDWSALSFAGGPIGGQGAGYQPPLETEAEELSEEEAAGFVREHAVSVAAPPGRELAPGGSATLDFVVTNEGQLEETFDVEVLGPAGWVALGSLPASVTLHPSQQRIIAVPVMAPLAAVPGDGGRVALSATPRASPLMQDQALATVATAGTDADGDAIADTGDNCLGLANTSQVDSDDDGFGNACDADFDGDLLVDFADLAYMRSVFLSDDRDADLDGNGVVNFADLARLKALFLAAPGPSALAP